MKSDYYNFYTKREQKEIYEANGLFSDDAEKLAEITDDLGFDSLGLLAKAINQIAEGIKIK